MCEKTVGSTSFALNSQPLRFSTQLVKYPMTRYEGGGPEVAAEVPAGGAIGVAAVLALASAVAIGAIGAGCGVPEGGAPLVAQAATSVSARQTLFAMATRRILVAYVAQRK